MDACPSDPVMESLVDPARSLRGALAPADEPCNTSRSIGTTLDDRSSISLDGTRYFIGRERFVDTQHNTAGHSPRLHACIHATAEKAAIIKSVIHTQISVASAIAPCAYHTASIELWSSSTVQSKATPSLGNATAGAIESELVPNMFEPSIYAT